MNEKPPRIREIQQHVPTTPVRAVTPMVNEQ
jgi:hypothetical protein